MRQIKEVYLKKDGTYFCLYTEDNRSGCIFSMSMTLRGLLYFVKNSEIDFDSVLIVEDK